MLDSTWSYTDKEREIIIPQVSSLFDQSQITSSGTKDQGSLSFISKKKADTVFGSEVKIDISWEKVDPRNYHHGLKVKESIDMYAAIQVVALGKTNSWHLSHERTIWEGRRQQVKQRRFYISKINHALFFCDQTQRIFDVHVEILESKYGKYEKGILKTIDSIQCHKI